MSHEQSKPNLVVFGIGGAGGNAVNNMIRSNLEGVTFVVANTDAQALQSTLCENRLQIGTKLTRGLGAGARPDIGQASAEEQSDEILQYLTGANLVFITAGMGGGTGTGAAPVIARLARDQGILTIGVVTKPFQFEGKHRMALAEQGIAELQQYVDTLIVIPNQNLFKLATASTTFADAFLMADDVLQSGVRGITDLMVMPGLINLDFADVRTVMSAMGNAMMGTGEADGEDRAVAAAEAAIANPLLDDVSMKGAMGVLINITGGFDLTLFEVDAAANRIREEVDPEANIIFGSTFDERLSGRIRVSVVATGIAGQAPASQPLPSATGLLKVPFGRSQPAAQRSAPAFLQRPAAGNGNDVSGLRQPSATPVRASHSDGAETAPAHPEPRRGLFDRLRPRRADHAAGPSADHAPQQSQTWQRPQASYVTSSPASSRDDDVDIPAFLRKPAV